MAGIISIPSSEGSAGVFWRMGSGRSVPLDRPRIVAILNATPDSFYGASRTTAVDAAAEVAARCVAEGADGLDVGGESTRPGAAPVPATEQIARVVPLIRAIRAQVPGGVFISVDTTRAEVARAALDAGADAVNDVSAGEEDPDMFAVAARAGCGLVLMHRLRAPGNDSYSDRYGKAGAAAPVYPRGVVPEVAAYLRARADAAMAAGVPRESIVVDPGLGFGKTVEQNLALIAGTGRIAELGFPILSALSRKSFVGRAMALPDGGTPEERLPGTIALSLAHQRAGASLFRVHDVAPHARALGACPPAGTAARASPDGPARAG